MGNLVALGFSYAQTDRAVRKYDNLIITPHTASEHESGATRPPTALSPCLRYMGEKSRLRPAQEAMDTTRLNLALSTPVIPKENILLIVGSHDLFADGPPYEELWQKWQQPEIWRLPHGHLSAGLVPGLIGRVIRWLAQKLEVGRTNNV